MCGTITNVLVYSQLSLKWTPFRQTPTVRVREVSIL